MTTQIAYVDRDEAVAIKAIIALEDEIDKLADQIARAKEALALSELDYRHLRESLAGHPRIRKTGATLPP